VDYQVDVIRDIKLFVIGVSITDVPNNHDKLCFIFTRFVFGGFADGFSSSLSNIPQSQACQSLCHLQSDECFSSHLFDRILSQF